MLRHITNVKRILTVRKIISAAIRFGGRKALKYLSCRTNEEQMSEGLTQKDKQVKMMLIYIFFFFYLMENQSQRR